MLTIHSRGRIGIILRRILGGGSRFSDLQCGHPISEQAIKKLRLPTLEQSGPQLLCGVVCSILIIMLNILLHGLLQVGKDLQSHCQLVALVMLGPLSCAGVAAPSTVDSFL